MSINIIKSKVTFHSWFSFSTTALKLLMSWKQHLNKSVANQNTKGLLYFYAFIRQIGKKHEWSYMNKKE